MLSLKAIVAELPAELRGAVCKEPSDHARIEIPRGKIEPQLASGAARISFGELRAVSPPAYFSRDAALDAVPVRLPMREILAQLKPARRTDQKRAEDAADVGAIFSRAHAATPAAHAAPIAAAPPQPRSHPSDRPSTAAPTGPAQPNPAAAGGASWFSTPRPASRAAVEKDDAPAAPITPRADAPAAAQIFAPPAPTAVTAATPAADCIEVPLAKIACALPEPARNALAADASLSGIVLRIPLAEIEPAITRGKVAFGWKRLQCWFSEPLAVSVDADASVDLPLPVIVPLFFGAKKIASAPCAPHLPADEGIPDIFNKAVARKPVVAATAPAPIPARVEESETVEILDGDLEDEIDEAGEIEMPVTLAKEPVHQALPPPQPSQPLPLATENPVPLPHHMAHPTPDQIIAQACALPNITGAFVATHDGLFVAGQTPGMNVRTMAAFVPNVFSQIRAYTLVAKLGQPDSVQIALPGRALLIVRCGRLFFGVLGQADEPFPTAQLTALAAQFHQPE